MDINSALPPTLSPTLSLDERKVEIEERKLQIEHQKLELERRKTNLTTFSILVPALLGVGAILLNGYGARQNAQRALELEAAKVLMQSESPEEVSGKAETFSQMFPQYLSSGFGSNFNPELFQNYGPSVQQRKKDLFQTLAPRYKTTREVATLYASLFPDETDWINAAFKLNLPLPEGHENRAR